MSDEAKCWSETGNCINSGICQAIDRCQRMPKAEAALIDARRPVNRSSRVSLPMKARQP